MVTCSDLKYETIKYLITIVRFFITCFFDTPIGQHILLKYLSNDTLNIYLDKYTNLILDFLVNGSIHELYHVFRCFFTFKHIQHICNILNNTIIRLFSYITFDNLEYIFNNSFNDLENELLHFILTT